MTNKLDFNNMIRELTIKEQNYFEFGKHIFSVYKVNWSRPAGLLANNLKSVFSH